MNEFDSVTGDPTARSLLTPFGVGRRLVPFYLVLAAAGIVLLVVSLVQRRWVAVAVVTAWLAIVSILGWLSHRRPLDPVDR
jgi:Flp pilus assembly protein TadB